LIEVRRIGDARLGKQLAKRLLVKCGVLKNTRHKVKLLAKGELKHKFDFNLDAYSEAAKAAIQQAGGKIL
jgi:large subunit ribosomal protein L15